MIEISKILESFRQDAAVLSSEDLKNKYLGRKNGIVSNALKELANLSLEEKQKIGSKLNQLRSQIEAKVLEKEVRGSAAVSTADLSIPGIRQPIGHLHPMTQIQKELEDIFTALGFTVSAGPEVETDWYNFTALNFPENHPARDMQDTFYINSPAADREKQLVLRTQTSNTQVRFMQAHKPPFAMVAPGIVYRNEATDATHEHTFMQMEGLVVGEDVNFAQMVWTLEHVLKKFFGKETKTKLLPTYFPFVEPGAEVAISSPAFKDGKWLEILGCGMVHQNVFVAAGYPKNKYTGFAFGFGLTRFALMKYGIPDIRLLSENNLQFLKQF